MECKLKGDELILTLHLEKGQLSSTGKSLVRFSSGGFQPIPGGNGLKVNVTVIQPQASK